jgi:hypothetical protein
MRAHVGMMAILTLFVAAVAMSHVFAQDEKHGFVGTWKLVSWENIVNSTGKTVYPLGEHAIGFIMYGADGQMCGELMQPHRPKFASADWLRGTPVLRK